MFRELFIFVLSTLACLEQVDSLQISTISHQTCDPNPCLNGGKCYQDSSAYGFYCTCSNGFYGYKCDKQKCPSRFQYRPATDTCIRVVLEYLTWPEARKRCKEIQGSYLTIVNSAEEAADQATLLQSYRQDLDAKCLGRSWISAQNDDLSCKTPVVWKPSDDDYLPLRYSNWNGGEPNCAGRLENCAASIAGLNYKWNDINCVERSCFICEVGPYE